MLYVRLATDGLTRLTSTYAGLGETGETLVLAPMEEGRAAVLHPVRFPEESDGTIELSADSADPFSQVLGGSEGAFWEGVTDYRGVPVWTVTRYLPETGWGLVVKVDDEEERQPIEAFRGRLTSLGLSLSAFAILLGTLLGLRLAKPIHDLAKVADQIRGGALSARAVVASEDEVGLLARTFNEMTDELERRMVSLQEYRKFFDVSLDMLCIAGTDGYFKHTNPSFERVLGWTAEELTRRPFFEIVHPEDLDATMLEIEKLAQGIPTVSFVNRFQCADGSYKRLLWTSFPDPETGRLYAIAHEVKERESL
jgi:PAS domain S-box-containing protein